MHTEPPAHSEKAEFKLPEAYRKPSGLHCVGYAPKRASLDLDFGPKVEAVPGAVCRRRNRPLSYGLNSPVTNAWKGLHERLRKPHSHRPQSHSVVTPSQALGISREAGHRDDKQTVASPVNAGLSPSERCGMEDGIDSVALVILIAFRQLQLLKELIECRSNILQFTGVGGKRCKVLRLMLSDIVVHQL